ncbi:MAG: hypothetical protein JNL98_42140, partial [Bryobacterales bacterium]|nr:hypothetical protein [Bryobacterales bacterium]
EELDRHALQVLGRELGVEGLLRFLRIRPVPGQDSTRDRSQWQAGVTVEEILASIDARNANTPAR